MDFPIILFYEEAQARLRNDSVSIPMLYSTAIILATQGASHIYVPTVGEEEKIKKVIHKLPPSIKARISTVDPNGTLLKRVDNFLAPLRAQVDEKDDRSLETHFVRELGPFMYQLMLGSKYAAGTTDMTISNLTHALHNLSFGKFRGEAKARLALIANLITSYRPFLAAHASVSGYVGDPGVRSKFSDIIETTEFQDVVDKFGYLGLLRRPQIGLNRLKHSVSALVNRKSLRSAAKAIDAVVGLAGYNAHLNTIVSIAGEFEKDGAFSPPVLDLNPFEYDIYSATLAEYDRNCKPPPGAIFQIQPHLPGVCGNKWAESDFSPTQYDSAKRQKSLLKCHLTATEAVGKFLRS